MVACFATDVAAIAIDAILVSDFQKWLETESDAVKQWLMATAFKPENQAFRIIPNSKGGIEKCLVTVKTWDDRYNFAALPQALPQPHCYQIRGLPNREVATRAAITWGLASYQFAKYKSIQKKFPKLIIDAHCDHAFIHNMVDSIYLTRDLINTPAEDMGPEHLAQALNELGAKHPGASTREIIGQDLIKENFPAIHAVGKAAARAPRLLTLRWGSSQYPLVSLVGKGVCFDTGGLNIKTTAGMETMKKDMGGAAHVMGLANMIMAAKLPIQLQVLIPAVENAISGNAYRPGDVLKTRAGKTVEVTNTDAEGRVVMSDALAFAMESKPVLVIDMATLTGAARVALGTDIPVFFTNQTQCALALNESAKRQDELVWQLPLYEPYNKLIESPIADIKNSASGGYGGAITAALFLQKFITDEVPWIHFDVMAWNIKSAPGRPQGGEAMGLQTTFDFIAERFGAA